MASLIFWLPPMRMEIMIQIRIIFWTLCLYMGSLLSRHSRRQLLLKMRQGLKNKVYTVVCAQTGVHCEMIMRRKSPRLPGIMAIVIPAASVFQTDFLFCLFFGQTFRFYQSCHSVFKRTS